MNRFKRALQATLVVHGFSIAAMLLSLITVPLYLHWLGQERYGLLLTGMTFGSYLIFADMGLSWASMLLIAQANGQGQPEGIPGVVRVSLTLSVLSASLVMAVVLAVWLLLRSPLRPEWVPGQEEAAGLALAVGLSVVITLLASPFYSVFMGFQETHIAGIYQGSARLVGGLASVAAASQSASLGGVFGANVACLMVVGGLAAFHCMRRHPLAFLSGPFWDRPQMIRQLRTGIKSFAMQVGNVLTGTAPVLTVSSLAGAASVPCFSVPLTLINTPLNVVNSFNASLQPGYGEAMGRQEEAWVATSIRFILNSSLVFMGLLVAGFLVLAQPFIQLWTGDKLLIPPLMLIGVAIIAVSGALLSIFRFALAGMNRHRTAGLSELVCGLLSLLCCALAVYWGGFAWVGFGSLAAVVASSGWILPRELTRTLAQTQPWAGRKFVLMILMAAGTSMVLGQAVLLQISPYGQLPALILSGVAISVCYILIIRLTCPVWWASTAEAVKRKILSKKRL